MMESNNTMKYLIGALIVTAIIFGYFYYGGGGSKNAVKSGAVPVTTKKVADAGGDPVFLQALLGLKNTDMSKDIFESQVFKSLKDFSRELVDEPNGRANPFAPIGVGSQYVPASAQVNTQTTNTNSTVAPSQTGASD